MMVAYKAYRDNRIGGLLQAYKAARTMAKVAKAAKSIMKRRTKIKAKAKAAAAPQAKVVSATTQGGGVRQIRGHKCRRKKQHVTEAAMKRMRDILEPKARLNVYVGPYCAYSNGRVQSLGLLGPNDNIPMGLPKVQSREGQIFIKCWMANCTSKIRAINNIARMNKLINDNYTGVDTTIEVGQGPDTNLFVNNTANALDIPGSIVGTTASFVPTTHEAQISVHRIYNPEISQVRVRAVYFSTRLDNTINPLYLWHKDLGMTTSFALGQAFYGTGDGIVGTANEFGTKQPYIALRVYADAVSGGDSTYFGDPVSTGGGQNGPTANPDNLGLDPDRDNLQFAGTLHNTQGKMVTPFGPHFRKFFSVDRVQTFTLQPGETLTLEHCQPQFTMTSYDYSCPITQDIDGSGLVPEYRPKYTSGIIFIVAGPTIHDVEDGAPLAAVEGVPFAQDGALGALNYTMCPPLLYHTYHESHVVRSAVRAQTNTLFNIGSLAGAGPGEDGYRPNPLGDPSLRSGTILLQQGGNNAVIQNPQVLGDQRIGTLVN